MTEERAGEPVIGVMDVGGGHVTAGVVDAHRPGGGVLAMAHGVLDPHAAREDLLAALVGPALTLVGSTAGIARWVIAMPGPFDHLAGSGSFAGVDKFEAIAGVDLRSEFGSRLGTDPRSVGFLNDAVAYGLGEWAVGAGGSAPRMVCITLGTGVGSAFLADGHEVASGPTVPPGGDAHRIEIDGQPLETVISTRAIRTRYREVAGRDRTVEVICAAARGGDAVATEVVDAAMRSLGRALAPWTERFGATRVVVGGGIARAWDVIGVPLRDELAVPVVPGLLGADAPLLGAAEWGRQAAEAERGRRD